MALALQEGGIGRGEWFSWVEAVPAFAAMPKQEVESLVRWMLAKEILWEDASLLWLGREGQDTYGRKNFLELFSVFTSPPEFTVLHGRQELGSVHETTFLAKPDPASVILLLAGRSWRLTHLDWKRRQAYVEPFEEGGRSRWRGRGQLLSHDLCRAIRLLLAEEGDQPHWSRRARQQMAEVRLAYPWVSADRTNVLFGRDGEVHWWTFGGGRANASLGHQIARNLGCVMTWDNFAVRLRGSFDTDMLEAALGSLRLSRTEEIFPAVNEEAVGGLKFSECLPPDRAAAVVQARLSDSTGVAQVLREPIRFTFDS
jgi:ATP-dependent Lhr-like helicase